MYLKELIEDLQRQLEDHGDLPVVLLDRRENYHFAVEGVVSRLMKQTGGVYDDFTLDPNTQVIEIY